MQYEKAQIAEINLGKNALGENITIEGLLHPSGEFGVAVPQVCSLFQFLIKNAVRDIGALLGNDFQFLKWSTTLNPKAVNVLRLPDFERVVFELALSGNSHAIKLSRDLIGLSLHQLFCDAFNVKFSADDRQAWLEARTEGKQARRTWTDAVRDWLRDYGYTLTPNELEYVWIHVSNAVNKGVFQRTAKQLRKDWQCENPRDSMTSSELRHVEEIERLAMRILDKHGSQGVKPVGAVHLAIEALLIPVCKR